MPTEKPVLELQEVSKVFQNAKKHRVTAVDKASLTLYSGETVGILGESGSGKSTLGQIIVGQRKPDSGKIFYRGLEITSPYRGAIRQDIQILFQHPEVSFNPRLKLESSLKEPYQLCGMKYSREKLLGDLEKFGLYEEHLERTPGSLSGGELQRAALARILTVNPKLIVLDEPTSMLDVISQAQMMEILKGIQREQKTSYLFITHNLPLCKAFADRIYLMKDGVLTLADDCETLRPEDYLGGETLQ